jgi:hypothetical protein
MANTNYTQADNGVTKFAGVPIDVLIGLIDERAKALFEKFNIIQCVARGGESLANSPNMNGDPVDSVSGGIFCSIINTATDASCQYDLHDAVAELRRIATDRTPV